jgi:Tol biopolymer transport system component
MHTHSALKLLPLAAVVAVALTLGAHASGSNRDLAANGAIVFTSPRASDLYGEVYAVGANGRGRPNLSRSQHADGSTTVTRTGTRVAFVSDRTGYSAVWTTTPSGLALRRITGALGGRRPMGLGDLAFGPRGRRIAFVASTHRDRWDVYLARTSAGAARRIAVRGA